MTFPTLTSRQREILRAVIRDYILTAEPVGSRTLSRKYGLGLSPATIRNELADLEDEGLLRQPHTSAGRVPSDSGYRLFVDSLMDPPSMARDKQALIEEQGQEAEDLSDLLHQTARLTAVLSGCTAIVRAPRQAGSRIRTLSLLPVGEAEALLVLVTTTGAVSHRLVRLPGATSPEELNLLSNFLGEQLRDRPLDGLTYRVLQDISRDLAKYQAHLEACCERLAIQPANGEQVIVSNTALLAQQPEFSASTKVGSLLSFLEEQEDLTRLMDALAAQEGAPGRARVRIGAENLLPDLQECSLVSATYSVGGELAGEIAVLGPTRLDYSTAIAAVTAMADRLTRALSTRFVP